MGATIKGYSLPPPTTPSLFLEARVADLLESQIDDIRDFEKLKKSLQSFRPDIIIHMAAQPLVRHSYQAPIETFSVNVMGTVNVLEAVLACETVKSAVFVTTDKCYENKEWIWPYRENEPMGGRDPYSSSKGCAELVISSYRASFYEQKGVGLASVRAGNVIGGGDWANDRLIPDVLNAFRERRPAVIRNPNAVRPWQHVLEPLDGYLKLAKRLYESPSQYSEAWNFGPNEEDAVPVYIVLDKVINRWPGASWKSDPSKDHPYEANLLRLDISKVKERLDWRPRWSLNEALNHVVQWHKGWIKTGNALELCYEDILSYSRAIEGYEQFTRS